MSRASLATLTALATFTALASGCGSSGHRSAVERCVERWNTDVSKPEGKPCCCSSASRPRDCRQLSAGWAS